MILLNLKIISLMKISFFTDNITVTTPQGQDGPLSKIWFRLKLNTSCTPRQHERYITYKLWFSGNSKAVLPNWSKGSLRRQGKSDWQIFTVNSGCDWNLSVVRGLCGLNLPLVPKKGNVKECSNYHTIVLFSHASKAMLKILQARLQQYINRELPDVQAVFRKGRGTRDQIENIRWIIGKAKEFQKNIYFYFIDYAKAFNCVDHNKLWKILKEMGIPDHLACFLRNL